MLVYFDPCLPASQTDIVGSYFCEILLQLMQSLHLVLSSLAKIPKIFAV